MKIYKCEICGNILTTIEDSNVTPICCNTSMKLLVPKTKDEKYESHVPVYKRDDDKVCVEVGKDHHPMTKEHYIKWIILETNKKGYICYLKPEDKPKAIFCICKDEMIKNVYAYCNIHSLWVSNYE